ncbi:hypothetical protein, partial [Acetomicrobium sp. S15 = DSM 107314]|uniref:hypothetical protein n=1 Tax=Acetomicrobium sp. S15 = DSM 107314 TaxID=2529858 RepID=UPI001E37A38C
GGSRSLPIPSFRSPQPLLLLLMDTNLFSIILHGLEMSPEDHQPYLRQEFLHRLPSRLSHNVAEK